MLIIASQHKMCWTKHCILRHRFIRFAMSLNLWVETNFIIWQRRFAIQLYGSFPNKIWTTKCTYFMPLSGSTDNTTAVHPVPIYYGKHWFTRPTEMFAKYSMVLPCFASGKILKNNQNLQIFQWQRALKTFSKYLVHIHYDYSSWLQHKKKPGHFIKVSSHAPSLCMALAHEDMRHRYF